MWSKVLKVVDAVIGAICGVVALVGIFLVIVGVGLLAGAIKVQEIMED